MGSYLVKCYHQTQKFRAHAKIVGNQTDNLSNRSREVCEAHHISLIASSTIHAGK